MDPLRVLVHVDASLSLPIGEDALARVVRGTLREEGVHEAEISLAVLSDEGIAQMNREYLSHEGPTDVISFSLSAPGAATVGDVYIGAEQAARQAEELGVGLAEELMRLAIHGTLHVLGYDHPPDPGREDSPMYRRQEELLRRLGATERPARS